MFTLLQIYKQKRKQGKQQILKRSGRQTEFLVINLNKTIKLSKFIKIKAIKWKAINVFGVKIAAGYINNNIYIHILL